MAGGLAIGPRAVLPGDERPRGIRRGRREARIGEAMRFGGGRRSRGRDVCAPVLSEWIVHA